MTKKKPTSMTKAQQKAIDRAGAETKRNAETKKNIRSVNPITKTAGVNGKFSDIIGQKVLHKNLGEGIVTHIMGKILYVRFQEKTVRFEFPEAIGVWLALADNEKAAEVERFMKHKEAPPKIEIKETAPKRPPDCVLTRVPEGRTQKKKAARNNVAFKLNYCNGGKTANIIGFSGVCSEEVIRYNIKTKHRVWCSNPYCDCRRFYDGEISYEDLIRTYDEGNSLCYESVALRDWIAFAGANANGDPRTLRSAVINKLGIFTTVHPNETDWLIFGAFMIEKVIEGDEDNIGGVYGNLDYCIELTPKEARKVHFWDYYKNSNHPESKKWGSGLVRYFDDDMAVKILQAMLDAKEDKEGKNKARRLLSRYCEANNIAMEQESGKESGL